MNADRLIIKGHLGETFVDLEVPNVRISTSRYLGTKYAAPGALLMRMQVQRQQNRTYNVHVDISPFLNCDVTDLIRDATAIRAASLQTLNQIRHAFAYIFHDAATSWQITNGAWTTRGRAYLRPSQPLPHETYAAGLLGYLPPFADPTLIIDLDDNTTLD